MPERELLLIKSWGKHLSVDEINSLPKGLRGFYVLYKYSRKTDSYNVVYVGMSSSGTDINHIKKRLMSHRKKKQDYGATFQFLKYGIIYGTMR